MTEQSAVPISIAIISMKQYIFVCIAETLEIKILTYLFLDNYIIRPLYRSLIINERYNGRNNYYCYYVCSIL